jgi:hypothetical protein
MTLLLATFDPAADPWGVAMIGSAVVVGFALLWAIVALLMRQPARGAGRLMSVGLFAYLGTATGGTWVRVMVPPPPPPPDLGEPRVIRSEVVADPDEATPGASDAKAAANGKPGKGAKPTKVEAPAELPVEAKARDATASDATASDATASDANASDANASDAKASPPGEAPAPAPTTPRAPEATAPPPTPVTAVPEKPTVAAVELGPPTLAGREALRFVDEVAHDDDKCSDPTQVAAAARELPGALDGMPRTRVERAAIRLEACRRKLVAARAWALRKAAVQARTDFADAIAKRLKADGISVLVTLRGAAKERIRIGGATLDGTTAARLLDGGLRDELVGLGFAEIVLANMKSAIKETPEVATDVETATAELAGVGLGQKIAVPR